MVNVKRITMPEGRRFVIDEKGRPVLIEQRKKAPAGASKDEPKEMRAKPAKRG